MTVFDREAAAALGKLAAAVDADFAAVDLHIDAEGAQATERRMTIGAG